jgi:hypothetical protein
MPLDILAILKGRRTWASTLDSEDEEEPRWWPETAEYEEDKGQSVEARETWGRADGWRLESGQDGRYALWIRPAAVEGAALMRGNDFAGDVGVIRRQASMRALLREILNDADILIRAAQIADEYKNGKSDDIKKRAA